LLAILVDQLGDAALHHVGARRVRVAAERRDQPLVDGLLDAINVRNAGRDVLRLDRQAGQARRRTRIPALGLLGKFAFVELVNEQHAVLLVSSTPRRHVSGSVACAGPPAYPPVSPASGRTADTRRKRLRKGNVSSRRFRHKCTGSGGGCANSLSVPGSRTL